MVESTGLLNRRTGHTVPQVRILSSPLGSEASNCSVSQFVAKASVFSGAFIVSCEPVRDAAYLSSARFCAVGMLSVCLLGALAQSRRRSLALGD